MIVYKIKNLINGKVYIGQTIHQLCVRWKGHRNDINRFDFALQRAMRKYGVENFEIIEIDKCEDQNTLNIRECFWINHYDSLVPNGYNIREGGADGKLSEETKQKISSSKMGQGKGRIPWNKGGTHTDEVKLKISLAMVGENNYMYGKTHTPEAIQKISDKAIKRKVMVDGICFISLQTAANYFNISKNLMYYRLKSNSLKYLTYIYL